MSSRKRDRQVRRTAPAVVIDSTVMGRRQIFLLAAGFMAVMQLNDCSSSDSILFAQAFQQSTNSHRRATSRTARETREETNAFLVAASATGPLPRNSKLASPARENQIFDFGFASIPTWMPSRGLMNGEWSNDSTTFHNENFTKKKRSMSELVALTLMGVTLATGIVYTLASSFRTETMELSGERAMLTTPIEDVTPAILDAAFPSSAAEMVTGTLGEASAGIVAAGSSLFTSIFISNLLEKSRTDFNREDFVIPPTAEGIVASLDSDQIWQQRQRNSRELGRRAVTDGDFFITQAAAIPLLEIVGVPSSLAVVGSTLLAAVPAEMVNMAARRRIEKQWEKLEVELIREEAIRKSLEKPFPWNLVFPTSPEDVALSLNEQRQQVDVEADLNRETVLVDIIADLIKWLGYGVIRADFSGTLTYHGSLLFPGIESAIFGVIAALSAQIYADCFFAIFGFGGVEKQDEIKSRSLLKWATTYVQVVLSSAALFGMYEFAQIPAKATISAVLSGGAENCYGSQDYDLCVETYLVSNPPGASPEAELRSLFATMVSFWGQFLD